MAASSRTVGVSRLGVQEARAWRLPRDRTPSRLPAPAWTGARPVCRRRSRSHSRPPPEQHPGGAPDVVCLCRTGLAPAHAAAFHHPHGRHAALDALPCCALVRRHCPHRGPLRCPPRLHIHAGLHAERRPGHVQVVEPRLPDNRLRVEPLAVLGAEPRVFVLRPLAGPSREGEAPPTLRTALQDGANVAHRPDVARPAPPDAVEVPRRTARDARPLGERTEAVRHVL